MRIGIFLGALGLALGAVSFALCFFSPLAAGLTGLAAGAIAFVNGAIDLHHNKGSRDGDDEASENAVPVPKDSENVQ